MTPLSKAWVPLAVAAAVTLGGLAVVNLRDAFGSEAVFSASGRSAAPLDPSYVKHLVYEVDGPPGTTGSVSYLDMNAQAHQVMFTDLPWSMTLSTTVPAVLASLVVQGDGDAIGCRITVNDEVKAQESANGQHAQTSCLVKAG